MARSRRFTPRVRRAKKTRPMDWVYHSESYGVQGVSLAGGPSGAVALPLLDSFGHLRVMEAGAAGFNTNVAANFIGKGAWERPEPAKTVLRGVDIHLDVITNSWAVSDILYFGSRILVAEQNMFNGDPRVDVNYSMFTVNPAAAGYDEAGFANEKRNLRERRWYRAFGDNGNAFQFVMRWRGRWTLQNNHCLFCYIESSSGSIGTRVSSWCRTLVEVPGR